MAPSQVNQSVDGGRPDQDPVMASLVCKKNLCNVIKMKTEGHKSSNKVELI